MNVLFYVLIGIAALGLLIIAVVLLFNRDRTKGARVRSRHRDRDLVVREATRRLAQDPRDVYKPITRGAGIAIFETTVGIPVFSCSSTGS